MSSKVIQAKLPCPSCTSSDAYHLYDDGHGFCYSCNYFKAAKEVFNPLLEEFTYEYVPLRGLTKESLKFYDVLTKVDKDGKPISLGFKYPNGSYKVRLLDKKDFYTQGDISKGGLFGRDKFSAGVHKYVTITEGEFDAISLHQVIGGPVVSVQSSSSCVRDCVLDIDWLRSFERIYLAFDNDEPGRAALAHVAKLFDYNHVFHVRMDRRKDANDYLQHGEGEELKKIWWNSKKYLPEFIISQFEEFDKILQEVPDRGVYAYPSATLNEMTDGIRTSEAVLITAPEGVGKTELMHHIEFNYLKGTPHHVGAIFLEEPKRRHLQAIAGLELGRPVHLPEHAASPTELSRAVRAAVVSDERLHIYSHFGSDDPEVLTDVIRYLVVGCGCRLILLDHISMAVSGLAGEDERRALDWLSTRLEMMVKELDFALVLVSHVNDFGQTRGSRYIGKVADIRIDMARDPMAETEAERNVVKFSIPKNRPMQKTGPAGEITYNPSTGRYEEHGDLFKPPQVIRQAHAPDRREDLTKTPAANDNHREEISQVA